MKFYLVPFKNWPAVNGFLQFATLIVIAMAVFSFGLWLLS